MKNVITADLGAMLAERRQLLAELKHRDKLLEETRLAWEMALKACDQLRAEKEKWSAWAKELGEKCDRLEAEAKAIRGQQPDAVSVPRELLESAEECIRAYGGGLPGADAIAGKLRALLSTKNAEEDQPCDK